MHRRPGVRRAAVASLVTGMVTAGVATVAPAAPAAPVPVVIIDGKGFGHGVGMAQDGAYWMGRAGSGTAQILGQFYPGSGLSTVGGDSPLVRVEILDAGGPPTGVVVSLPESGMILDGLSGPQSPGFPVRVPAGGNVTLGWDGVRYTVVGGTATVSAAAAAPATPAPGPTITPPTLPQPTTTVPAVPRPTTTSRSATTTTTTTTTTPPSRPPGTSPPPSPPGPGPGGGPTASSGRPLWVVPTSGGRAGQGTTTVVARGRTYRGALEAVAEGQSLHVVDQVVVEDYLKGMGEVLDPSWPPASLRVQAIAARTYALRAMSTGGQLCDDERCQVYLGAQAEYLAMDLAVDATRSQVLSSGGHFADTVYSSNGGGWSASRLEGFGVDDGADYPYLRPAPYPTNDPLPWTTTVALSDVAARLNYHGQLTSVMVTRRGASFRALEVTLNGSSGPVAVSGLAFAAGLGLRSTLATVRPGVTQQAPPPPGAAGPLQLPPDQVGGLAPLARAGTDAARAGGPVTSRVPFSPNQAAGRTRPAPSAGLPAWMLGLAGLLLALCLAGLARVSRFRLRRR